MRAWLAMVLVVAVGAASARGPQGARAPDGPVQIPFELEGSRIVVQAEIEPDQRLPFLFDSGLSRGHLITPEAAAILGLIGGKPLGFESVEGERREAVDVQVPRLRVGEAELRDQPFAILALPATITARPGRPALAGMLGAPLLDQAVLCIDYPRRVLLRGSRAAFDATGWSSVPMPTVRGLPTITVEIDGVPASLIVDTGNNGAIVVDAHFAQRAEFARRYPEMTRGTAHTGGATFETQWAEAERVSIGPDARLRTVPLMILPPDMDPRWGVDGLIGHQVLSMLDPCLDRDGQRFLFRKRG